MSDENEGWGFPLRATKAHYFFGWRSLCMRWGYTGRLTRAEDAAPNVYCSECRKRLLARSRKAERPTK